MHQKQPPASAAFSSLPEESATGFFFSEVAARTDPIETSKTITAPDIRNIFRMVISPFSDRNQLEFSAEVFLVMASKARDWAVTGQKRGPSGWKLSGSTFFLYPSVFLDGIVI
jgi:hypothetical protein